MILEINFDSEIPIYTQIVRQIIVGIAEGELELGESLPSVRALAEDIGVNLHTVNKAYQELKALGYVSMDRRKGAAIAECIPSFDKENEKKMKDDLYLMIADSLNRGMTPEEIQKIINKKINKVRGEKNGR